MQSEHQELMEQIVEQTLLLQKISAQLQVLIDLQGKGHSAGLSAPTLPDLDAADTSKAPKPIPQRQAPTI